MFLTFLTIYSLWDNQLSWVIALPLIILGVLCKIEGRDRSLERSQSQAYVSRGQPSSSTLFLFLLLQLLQFLLFLPLLFGMLILVTHLSLGYNNQLLEVCQVQCLKKILIASHVSQENNQLYLSILVNQYSLISLTLFILMFRSLPLSLVLLGLDILLSLLMITLAITGFLI